MARYDCAPKLKISIMIMNMPQLDIMREGNGVGLDKWFDTTSSSVVSCRIAYLGYP
jgi:hypothetical protein